MNFTTPSILVVDQYQKKGTASNGEEYFAAHLPGIQLFNIGEAIPAVQPTYGPIGFVKPYELHISAQGTIVFFTFVAVSAPKNASKTIAWLYEQQTGESLVSSASGSSDDNVPGMSGAMRMMMGENRSPRDIAGRSGSGRRSGRPRAGGSLYDSIYGGSSDDDDY